jgi:hypothetical protein
LAETWFKEKSYFVKLISAEPGATAFLIASATPSHLVSILISPREILEAMRSTALQSAIRNLHSAVLSAGA